ncbi:MAG: malate dehydrogenase [Gemmatimonadota bacterium]|nr:malate dehydrogenase [Gemmatimonadota bacterium]MDP6461427.1 malate dehydrogenase [Gemmatimonadota bacterium]MDP6529057.1 malate dehydrogenase [Gemmatimonadota bacterium]MDP6802645.1 malate dehydrogenase [Gemmatimonadota bacterium]MDP7031644.1 malate dehydrogenase [Gemmatimonadota bacterium]
MLEKIGVIGAGNIGGVLVQELVRRQLARTIAVTDPAPFVNPEDPPERQETTKSQSVARGKALDILEGTPLLGSDVSVEAGRDYDVLAGCDMVINTAGVPRKARPDGTFPSRDELLSINLKVTGQVAKGIADHCPDATVISVANPLDAIVYTLYRKLGIPKNRLIGMAGVLDSARYRWFVAQAAGVSVDNVEALVLGGHGDTMVPVRSCCRIAGMPVEKFVSSEDLDAIEARTRKAGGEVVGLLGFGSAFVSPALSALEMAESILFDRKKVTPVCTLLEGEYGVDGLFVGVPAVLGANGVEKIIETELTDAEATALEASVSAVRTTCEDVDRMLEQATPAG